ncbi:thioredoxin family protein [uncultured Ralstonia sp.]|jgi:predicted dithiol-disulfide oxidoreductase (DUF899 family)|uniref:DUF899 domain-containing protein n=1 Tax=Ralstonia sp. TaxID=54061 RepID=UPI001EA5CC4A|nr:thioredoxin family protein [uncultured Ralstonia sp.]UCF24391.1 MAG: thioredoxin family protein [Ralstonia sp.]
MQQHPVVSQEEWLAKRRALLAREKEAIHLRDAVNAERQALPWVKVDTQYVFDTLDGKRTLAELFGARSQLMVYHFMLGPGWSAGCHGCSFVADHFDGMLAHLNHHDVTLTAVSRAPLAEIEAYKARMGWRFPWVSSFGSTFNHDYHVSFTPEELAGGDVFYNFTAIPVAEANDELPGLSAFYKDEAGNVFHTYSTYARGLEDLLATYQMLDRAPMGRNETKGMDWVRRHDEYEGASKAHACHAS